MCFHDLVEMVAVHSRSGTPVDANLVLSVGHLQKGWMYVSQGKSKIQRFENVRC